MNATHRVKTTDRNTIGFMVDGVFYTNDYIRRNIEYITNMSLQENGVPKAERELPELDYKKDIIDKEYDKLAETFVYNELHRLFKVPYTRCKVKEDEVCFSVYEQYELDFMVVDKRDVIYGIEVKAKDGNPKSLKVFRICRKITDTS